MRSIAIYCGSALGNDPAIAEQAIQLGKILAQNNIKLIYGGAAIGVMGAIADSCLQAGGTVVGVMPRFMKNFEVAHDGLNELHWVDSMHQRKALIVEMAEAFITLPGGFGTLDELFECLTWKQLSLHHHPIGLLNINHFYDSLIDFINHANQQHFIRLNQAQSLIVDSNPHALIAKLLAHSQQKSDKNFMEKS